MSARSRKAKAPEQEKHESTTSSSRRVTIERSRVSSGSSLSRSAQDRSPSPLNITRNEEKDELAHLNDRLASYIDYVRQLERDKERLTRKVHSISEERMSNVDEVRKTYEDEIASLRRLVDDLAKQKAALEVELAKQRDDAQEAKSKLVKRDLEVRNLQRRIDMLERELSNYKQDHDRYQQLKPDFDALEKQCKTLKRDLEAEILLRTDLENKVAGLKEELDFKNRVFDEERQKLVHRSLLIEEEVEGRQAGVYESRLADELKSIRQQTADDLSEYKLQMEYSFQSKFDQLNSTSNLASDEAHKLRDEMLIMRKRSDELAHELSKKVSEVELLQRRVNDLERMLADERENFESQRRQQELENRRLQSELEERFHEFTELMNTKIALDQEILMYRKMLEGEESRLDIKSPSHSSVFNVTGKKRRLDVDYDDESSVVMSGPSTSKARYSYRVSTAASGGVEFTSEQDGQGHWVKLVNSSTEDVSLGNWVLKHQADGRSCTFKFHRTVNMKPGTTCTVWSSDTEATHNPPTDLVMKNQAFNAGGNIGITLLNTDGEEQCSCSVVRERIKATGAYSSHKRFSRHGAGDEKCSAM